VRVLKIVRECWFAYLGKSHGCYKRALSWPHESGFRYVFHGDEDKNRELTITVSSTFLSVSRLVLSRYERLASYGRHWSHRHIVETGNQSWRFKQSSAKVKLQNEVIPKAKSKSKTTVEEEGETQNKLAID
jgi:hypothetical protein